MKVLGPVRARSRRRSALAGPRPDLRTWMVRAWWALRGVGLGVAVLACTGAALWGLEEAATSSALSLRAVEVTGNSVLPAAEVRRLAGVRTGEPLLTLDLARVRSALLRHPWVADAAVARRWPDGLLLTVRERTPAALLAQPGGFALLDGEGVVLETGPARDGFPIVTGLEGAALPGRAVAAAKPALAALAALARVGVGSDRVSEVRREGDRLLVSLVGTGTVLVLAEEAADSQAARLARFMVSPEWDLSAAGYDLRFAGRVVRLPDREEPAGEEKGKRGSRSPGRNNVQKQG